MFRVPAGRLLPFALLSSLAVAFLLLDATQAQTGKGKKYGLLVGVKEYRHSDLRPLDYTENYVDIVATPQVAITIDGQAVTAARAPVGTGGFSVYRVRLGPGQAGAHVLTASERVGIQVVGYGTATSYMYPGGLDLANIAPPPAL